MAPGLQNNCVPMKIPPQQKQINTAVKEEIVAPAAVEASGPWQTECCKLNTRTGIMLKRGLWTDCELLVGKESTRFAAHRALLSGASPVFAAMLYGSRVPAGSDIPFHLPNVEPETFKLLLEYIYTDNIFLCSCDMACEIYKEAEYFIMPHLKSISKRHLIENVTSENVLQIFEFSKMYDDNEIKEKCLKIITEKTEEVLKGPGLEAVSVHTLEQLFAFPELTITSDLELVKAADRWLRAQNKIESRDSENGMSDIKSASAGGDDNVVDSKVFIRKAIQQIRFLTIHPKKFVEYDTTHLLYESDMLAISFNMQSRIKSIVPMPKGFSTSLETRRKRIFTVLLYMSNFMEEVKVAKTSSISYLKRYYFSKLLPWFFHLTYKNETLYWSILILDPNWRTYNKVLCKAYITVKLMRACGKGPPLVLETAKVKFVKHKNSTIEQDNCSYDAPIPQLSLDDLMDPLNGYLQKGALKFEVHIVTELLEFDSV